MTVATSKGRILLGQDVRVTACKMSEALREQGYEVEVAIDGDECLRKAHENPPDLLVLDMMMPKVHGIGILKTLQEEPGFSKVGVILCVAKDLKMDNGLRAQLGRFDLLLKPFEIPEFVERVGSFFARRRRAAGLGNTPEVAEEVVEDFKPRLATERGRFSLWGTRGSTPTPGARFLRHGGNTSCLSVTYGEDKFIFDAGSGIRDLGLALLTQTSRRIHLFITHTHWDHIQGFPFFAPAYVPGFAIDIYGAEGFGKDLESVFRGQLDREYFPVQMDDMNSSICFRHLASNPLDFGDVKIHWEFAQHPGATVGYKVDVAGYKIAWVPDNEFMQGYTGSPDGVTIDSPLVTPYRRMIDFLSDVDVLIHEAQYTNDEYPEKVGWGHSSVSNACLLAKFANVKRWIVTHHDPMHDDAFLETKLNITRQLLHSIGHECHVTHGYDGLTEYL